MQRLRQIVRATKCDQLSVSGLLTHKKTRPISHTTLTRQASAKQLFDFAMATMGLVLSSPLWLLVSLAIVLDDGRPVFYSQERVGKGGRRFRSWKFRSMIRNSDERFGPLQACLGDTRVTRVGRFLRATGLDELPQFWNIIRGDLSFVGPRALLPEEIEVHGHADLIPLEKISGYQERHIMKPGLTGLAQVYAPRDILRRQKFRYDFLYIQKQSLGLDLKLFALSLWIALRGQCESRGKKF